MMIRKIIIAAVVSLFLGTASMAQQFPGHYPKDGFQRVGTVDDVQLDRQVVVINDIPYALASNAILHSMSSYSVSMTQLTPGSQIGYKLTSSGRIIMEIWLLPQNYKSPRQR